MYTYMSSKKSIIALTVMFAAMAMSGTGFNKGDKIYIDDDEPKKPKKNPIPAGCKEYSFYGVTVVALNEKSAIKKCKKKAGIK